MKYKRVFLLGRPGCGKSALYRELEARVLESGQAITLERVDDFPKVWAKLRRDDALEQSGKARIYSKRTGSGGYLFTNDELFNDVLQELNADLLEIDQPNRLVVVEFARNSYIEALQRFDRRLLVDCFVIYMEVSFDICWMRNVARHKAAGTQDGDDHMVGREAMEAVYLHDDQDAFVAYMKAQGIPFLVVNNEADGEDHLQVQVEQVFANLF